MWRFSIWTELKDGEEVVLRSCILMVDDWRVVSLCITVLCALLRMFGRAAVADGDDYDDGSTRYGCEMLRRSFH